MDPLLPSFRRQLRARAHALHPVVSIGQHGLTPSVIHEIDVALLAHELVKVRIFSDDRSARAAMLDQVCNALDCAAVQQIGKLLVLWRARPPSADEPALVKQPRKPRPAAAPPSSAASARRRRATVTDATRGVRDTDRRARAVPLEPAKPRPPGKAPSGVPRAAAPRRRRRGA
jgi:putative YhbY family RNA-binding protein